MYDISRLRVKLTYIFYLVGCIHSYITMHGPMNVKFMFRITITDKLERL